MHLKDGHTPWELVVAYFARELDPETETAVEDHWVECEACAHTGAVAAGLVTATRELVGKGFGLWALTPDLLERFRAAGLRIHERQTEPGGRLYISAAGPSIDLLIGRLRGDFSGLESVDVVFDMHTGPLTERDVPVTDPAEVVIACVMHLRTPPGTEIRTECRIEHDGRVLATYHLAIDVAD